MTTIKEIDDQINAMASENQFTIRGHVITLYDEDEDVINIVRICSCGEKDITLYFLKDKTYGIMLHVGKYYYKGAKDIMEKIKKELAEFMVK